MIIFLYDSIFRNTYLQGILRNLVYSSSRVVGCLPSLLLQLTSCSKIGSISKPELEDTIKIVYWNYAMRYVRSINFNSVLVHVGTVTQVLHAVPIK